jgi:hypothetical protein
MPGFFGRGSRPPIFARSTYPAALLKHVQPITLKIQNKKE